MKITREEFGEAADATAGDPVELFMQGIRSDATKRYYVQSPDRRGDQWRQVDDSLSTPPARVARLILMAIQAPGMDQYVIRLVCLAVGLFSGMAAGVYVHELGHQAACVYLGYESGGVTIDMSESSHTCVFGGIVPGVHVWAVQAAGGGLAAGVFGAALAAFLLWARGRDAVLLFNGLVPCFVLAGFVSQSVNFVLEAGLGGLYDEVTRALGVACSVFLVACIWYAKLPRSSQGRRGRIRPPPGSRTD